MSEILISHILPAWIAQTLIVATVGALLPIVFRVRHPRTQLFYCHAVLALCLLLPFAQGIVNRSGSPGMNSGLTLPNGPWLPGILAAGIALQWCLMSAGLWRIRRSRIAATPLYPIPEAMQAASAITQADALFCMSEDTTGPVMLGWLAPVVLLPASFLKLNEEAQCGIACHELLHVRRGDWLVTMIESFFGALMWFNPGVWLLLSEALLAREQLVDAESVRLTASREPYIYALLAIAREHTWSDLVPAPAFLRRSHLTQRMQSLLSDSPASAPRVFFSYSSIAAILACTIWLACSAFPMLGQAVPAVSRIQAAAPAPERASAPSAVPAQPAAAPSTFTFAPRPSATPELRSASPFIDPYEPVAGGVQLASTSDERASVVELLATARFSALRHAAGVHPYKFQVSFTAADSKGNTEQGELTETWMTGQKWLWTASLGGVSHEQMLYKGTLFEDHHIAVIPMRAHVLRNEIFWALGGFTRDARIRTAKVQWQGKPATCVLGSDQSSEPADIQRRLWDEEEYCTDDASGFVVVHSVAPGTYAQFGYDGQLDFHGMRLPDRIRIYEAGTLVAEAVFSISDTSSADETSLIPGSGMTSRPLPTQLGVPFHYRVDSPEVQPAGSPVQLVVVHAEIDGDGNVLETELSAASNAALVPAALEQAGKINFGHTGTARQGYIGVRFVPASQ